MGEKDTNPKDAIGTAKWRQFMVVPRQVLWEVGVGMLEGALKYGRHNYRGAGVRASVYCDAALGHIEQFIEGEDIDADSGLSHVTKAICSLVVLRDAMMNDFWTDDRPPKIKDIDELRDRLQAIVDDNFKRYEDKDPHHYTQENDPAPYQDTVGMVYGVNMDRYEHAALRRMIESGEWNTRVVEEITRDTLRRKPVDLPPTAAIYPEIFSDGYDRQEHVFLGSMADIIADDGVAETPDVGRTAGELTSLLEELGFTMWYDAQEGIFKAKRTEDLEPTDFDAEAGLGYWNASDEDFENQTILSEASDRRIQRDLLAHAQSVVDPRRPIAGYTIPALELLAEWREAEGGAKLQRNEDEVAWALAHIQWAKSAGIIDR